MHSYLWVCTVAESLKKKLFPNQFKIIFVSLFFPILLSSPCVSLSHFLSKLSQAHSLKLLPLCLTGGGGGCVDRSVSMGGWVCRHRWAVVLLNNRWAMVGRSSSLGYGG